MGDDWCAMRVPKGKEALARNLIETRFQIEKHQRRFRSDLAPYFLEDGVQIEVLEDPSIALAKVCELGVYSEEEATDCHRMSPIGRSEIYPPEWCIAAYRSFLSDEVPAQVKQWKGYIQEVEAGSHRGYLLELYLYYEGLKLLDFHKWLADESNASRAKTNAWAERLRLTGIHEEIDSLTIPENAIGAPPRWVDWEKSNDTDIDFTTKPGYIALRETTDKLQQVKRDYNRRVPSNQKLDYYPETFDEFLSLRLDYWLLKSLFNWLEERIEAGEGLYLWC